MYTISYIKNVGPTYLGLHAVERLRVEILRDFGRKAKGMLMMLYYLILDNVRY